MLLFVGITYGWHKPLMKDTVDVKYHITFINFLYCFMTGIMVLVFMLKIAKILSNADLPFVML